MAVTAELLCGGTRVYVDGRHRFGTDAMLLSDFCGVHRDWAACDLGSGCGIIPLRWHDAGHRGPCWGIELDPQGTALLLCALVTGAVTGGAAALVIRRFSGGRGGV